MKIHPLFQSMRKTVTISSSLTPMCNSNLLTFPKYNPLSSPTVLPNPVSPTASVSPNTSETTPHSPVSSVGPLPNMFVESPAEVDYGVSIQSAPQQIESRIVNTHPMVTRSKVGIFKPKVYLSKVDGLSDEEPVNIHEAIKSD